MIVLSFPRIGLGICALLAFLSGCAGSQGSALPPNVRSANAPMRGASSSSGALLYVATKEGVLIATYPALKVIGSLPVSYAYPLVCSDPNNGNVFVSESTDIVEYAHGGTTPIATLYPPSGYGTLTGCAVNPATGDLAVGAVGTGTDQNAVLVYPGGQGNPTIYTDKYIRLFAYSAYDDAGNLFATVFARNGSYKLVELPAKSRQFKPIKIDQDLPYQNKLQWDGNYITLDDWNGAHFGSTLYQVQVKGKYGTVVGSETLHQSGVPASFWIYNGSIISTFGRVKPRNDQAVALWNYPEGGYPTSKRFGMTKGKSDGITDVTISVGSTR